MVDIKHPTFGANNVGKAPAEPVSKLNATDLRSLIELGCVREDVDIAGKVFVMKSLNTTERTTMSQRQSKDLSEQQILDVQLEILALSIESVDGVPLEDHHPDKSKDPILRRKEILGEMQSHVIISLLERFTLLTEKADGQFSEKELQNFAENHLKD